MVYRNKLRKAAIWILINTCRSPQWKINKLIGIEVNQVTYPWLEFKDLVTKRYPQELLRAAVDFLYEKRDIDLLDNALNRFDIKVRCTSTGAKALNEHIYQDDISNYRNERLNKMLNWRISLISAAVAVASLVYGIANSIRSSEVRDLQVRLDKLERAQNLSPAGGKILNPAKNRSWHPQKRSIIVDQNIIRSFFN